MSSIFRDLNPESSWFVQSTTWTIELTGVYCLRFLYIFSEVCVRLNNCHKPFIIISHKVVAEVALCTFIETFIQHNFIIPIPIFPSTNNFKCVARVSNYTKRDPSVDGICDSLGNHPIMYCSLVLTLFNLRKFKSTFTFHVISLQKIQVLEIIPCRKQGSGCILVTIMAVFPSSRHQ